MIGLAAGVAKLVMRRDNGLLTAYEVAFIAVQETGKDAPTTGVR